MDKPKPITLFSKDFRDLTYLWQYQYSHKEYKIEKAIKPGFCWSRLQYGYKLKIRKLTAEEMESPIYKEFDGDIIKAIVSAIDIPMKMYKELQEQKKQRKHGQ